MAELLDEPAWLVAMLDQRIALVLDKFADQMDILRNMDMCMLTLTEPPEHETIERWERTCDRCGTYVPGEGLMLGSALRTAQGIRFVVTLACCEPCSELR